MKLEISPASKWLSDKESTCSVGDAVSVSQCGRFPEVGNDKRHDLLYRNSQRIYKKATGANIWIQQSLRAKHENQFQFWIIDKESEREIKEKFYL